MKKMLLSLALFVGTSFTMWADGYAFLTFETTGGDKYSVPASSLTITLSGSTLYAGGQTFAISNLSKMYFSSSNITTGIANIAASEWEEVAEIYDLNGRKVNKSQALKGIYVVKDKNRNYKIVAK